MAFRTIKSDKCTSELADVDLLHIIVDIVDYLQGCETGH